MIDKNDVIRYAATQGYKVTPRMLRYWQSIGLIPAPENRYPGRGKGSQSFYPDGTEKRVVAICKLPRKERTEIDVLWQLWRMGEPLSVRNILAETLEEYKQFVSSITDKEGRLKIYDPGLDQIIFGTSGPPTPLLRRVRKNTGSSNYQTIKYLVCLVFAKPAIDVFDKDKEFDRKVFNKGVGDFLSENVLPVDLYLALTKIRRYLSPENIAECLADISDQDLKTACDELDNILEILWLSYVLLKALFEGKKPAQRYFMKFDRLSAKAQALFLLWWLSFRSDPHLYESYKILSGLFSALTLQL